MIIFFRTNDPSRNVRIGTDGQLSLVPALPETDFSLTNVVRPSRMILIRAFLAAQNLKLRRPNQIAVRH